MLLLPLYLNYLGASRAEIGAAMAMASIGGLLGRPLVGWGLDVVGRKPVLVVGTLLLTLGMCLVAAITTMGPLVYGMRILVGLGVGTLFTGYFTLAADLVPAERRIEGLALFGISGLVPLAVNPLAPALGFEPADLRFFFPLMGIGILSSLLFLWGVPDKGEERSPEDVTLAKAMQALRVRAMVPVWTATFVFAGLVAVFMSFVTVAGEARNVGNPAAVWFAYAGGAAFVRLFAAKLPERVGPTQVGIFSLALYSLGFVIAADAVTTWGFVAAGVFAGIGHGYCFPVLSGQVVTRSPIALRGVALAAFMGLWEVARLLLAPSFGALADMTGDGTMMRAAALTGVVGVVLWFVLDRMLPVHTQDI